MKKKINKIFFGLLVASMIPVFTVSAYTPKDLSQYAKEITEAKKQIVEGGIEIRNHH